MRVKSKEITELIAFLDEKKAVDILSYDMREVSPLFDDVIIASALNSRQLESLATLVGDYLEENGRKVNHIEGNKESGWIIIDAYDVIIHIMSLEERERVNLEEILDRVVIR